ncbi:hypothetical protein MIND_00775900 [Mycena indigotica]|uniref:Alpha/beta-hydrolase n=1 Tax=Mycena indigotica TaxID=2126181 RepID=A0A8H6SNK9_9AGAR|nr:uncharacterized protein MIND_00775900 [Mycena indigotica]KAF7302092.1 hypothetical protein MIND_00775900 [Mycena indigotica]
MKVPQAQFSNNSSVHRRRWYHILTVVSLTLVFGLFQLRLASSSTNTPPSTPEFYHNISTSRLCGSVSHSGHIGLAGDSEQSPKRSFFWYFEAEEDPWDAPIILTVGGGPGTSGLMNPLFGQSACLVTEHGLSENPNRWTQKHNLIALDHPIGAGFSYGSRVNSSHAAALDAYDFLQKFFVLFPHLSGNKFFVSGGSYGGVYVPHIAIVIHEENQRILEKNSYKRVHINLDALILSNPFTSPRAHFSWLLQYRCSDHHIYNTTDCDRLYSLLPKCLDSIELAFQEPTVKNRVASSKLCYDGLNADLHGTVQEDIRRKCIPQNDAPDACHPEFNWIFKALNDSDTRQTLGVPSHLEYVPINMQVNAEFHEAGDLIQQHHLLYPPLIAAGIRLLHYIGMQDANCPWPGTVSFLNLLPTTFRDEFNTAPELPWPSEEAGTVRSAGLGAGNVTLILLREAGHFTVKDQPALAKTIVEHWVANEPFL